MHWRSHRLAANFADDRGSHKGDAALARHLISRFAPRLEQIVIIVRTSRIIASLFYSTALLLGTLPLAQPLQAATFTVTTTTDAPQQAGAGGNCVSTVGGCTLHAAIQAANSTGGGPNVINIPPGNYVLN